MHIFNEIRSKMNKMFETNIFVEYQFNHQYHIYNFKKKMIKTSIVIEFYETHFKKPLLIQKFKQKEFEIFEKNYSDDDFANHQTTRNLFENNDSDPQNVFEIIKMSDNDESENASNSIRIERRKADLPTSMKGDLEIPRENDLQTSEGDDLQTGKLPNLVKAPENKADEGESQAAPDFARERIPKSRRHKTMAPTAASERPRRERRAYDPKAFDKEKASVALTAKSAGDRIVEPKTYQEAIIGPDKEKWMAAIREELIALISKGTWVRRKLPKGKNLVTSKWIFKMKYKQDGIIKRFKARLIARGFTQKYGINYEETFVPTL